MSTDARRPDAESADPVRAARVVRLDEQGATVPGWALRAAAAVAGGGLVVVLATLDAPVVLIGVVVLLVALSTLSPASAAPAATIGAVALGFVVVSPNDPVVGGAAVACVVLGHALHVAAGFAAAIPAHARLHVRALRRPLLRFAAIEAIVLGIAAVVLLLPARQNPVALEVAAVVLVAALAGVPVYLLLRRR